MSQVTTSVTVTYDPSGGGALSLQNESQIKPPYGTAYARLFASKGLSPSLISTSGGGVQTINSAVTESYAESVMFTGSNTANLQIPSASGISIARQGTFFDRNGKPISDIHITVDPDTGTLKASQACYGAVIASYTGTFRRIASKFQKLASKALIDKMGTEFSPLMFLAFAGAKSANVTVNPPPLSEANGADTSTAQQRLILELDSAYPVDIKPLSFGVTARAAFWVYPGDSGATLDCTAGVVFGAGDLGLVTGSQNNNCVLNMKEPLAFNNGYSASLRYPPAGGVSVISGGDFGTPFGGSFTPSFVTPGGTVELASWFSDTGYTLDGFRKVGDNEVMLTSGRITRPGTGVAIAQYSTLRTRHIVEWSQDAGWFQPVVVFAQDIKGRYGELKIEPPVRRGLNEVPTS